MDFFKNHQASVYFYRALKRNFILGRCLDNASVLTITTLLALVPMITMIYSAMRLMPGMEMIGDQIQDWIFAQFIPSKADEIQASLASFTQQTSKLTVVGSLMLLVTSIMMLVRIEACLNAIWQVSPTNSGIASFLRYWAVLSLGPIFIGAGVLLTSYVTSLKAFDVAFNVFNLQSILLSLFPIILTLMALTLIYVTVPNCSVPVVAGLLGACVAGVLFELAKRAFAWAIQTFPSYELIYGAFAALPIFIIWLNLLWVIILFGGVVSRTLATDVFRKRHYDDIFAGVEVLAYFYQAQKHGALVNEKELLKTLSWLPKEQWDDIRVRLTQAGWMTTSQKDFLLTGQLDGISQLQALKVLGWVRTTHGQTPDQLSMPSAKTCADQLFEVQSDLQSERLAAPLTHWFTTPSTTDDPEEFGAPVKNHESE